MAKAFGAVLILLACILFFPLAIGLIAGAFGIVVGVIGGVFGAIFGIIGGVFGAIFGFFEWMFDGLFDWHGFGFWNCSPLTVFLLAIIVALLLKGKPNNQQKKTP